MYSKVDFPKRVTEKWLKAAFAPLNDYLRRECPEAVCKILPYMMFYCNEDQRFYYRNSMTKASIIFDQAGHLVVCDKDALKHDFEDQWEVKVNRRPSEERFVHPNVTRWIKRKLNLKAQQKFGEEITIFLQELWGPLVNYDFGNLEVGLPVRSAHLRYCLFLHPSEMPRKIAIQFVGDEIVEKRCSYEQYREYEMRRCELVCAGWNVITIIREILDYDLDRFRQYLSSMLK